ncbi:hypothetical protein J4457_02720 [Candidatus Woesearchaeota archaeon]|nr:hypothetical protein [Candidatus Woesearchaeota archaeon]
MVGELEETIQCGCCLIETRNIDFYPGTAEKFFERLRPQLEDIADQILSVDIEVPQSIAELLQEEDPLRSTPTRVNLIYHISVRDENGNIKRRRIAKEEFAHLLPSNDFDGYRRPDATRKEIYAQIALRITRMYGIVKPNIPFNLIWSTGFLHEKGPVYGSLPMPPKLVFKASECGKIKEPALLYQQP